MQAIRFESSRSALQRHRGASSVLSDGEQTAAAFVDFLTEVEPNGSCVGVIFDGPVTSMDHVRKESIAQRLVDEAARREVIFFTHDIFVYELPGNCRMR